jgi:hypothetical protein
MRLAHVGAPETSIPRSTLSIASQAIYDKMLILGLLSSPHTSMKDNPLSLHYSRLSAWWRLSISLTSEFVSRSRFHIEAQSYDFLRDKHFAHDVSYGNDAFR